MGRPGPDGVRLGQGWSKSREAKMLLWAVEHFSAERLSVEMRCEESPPERDCYLGSLQSAQSVWNAAMVLDDWSDADSVAGRTFQMTFNPNENMVSNLEQSPKFSKLAINLGLSSSSAWIQCVVYLVQGNPGIDHSNLVIRCTPILGSQDSGPLIGWVFFQVLIEVLLNDQKIN